MTYKVRLSKKNQGNFSVQLLKELGIEPNKGATLVVYEDINGKFVIESSRAIVDRTAGSLHKYLKPEVKRKLQKLSSEELLKQEQQSIEAVFSTKSDEKK